MNWVLLVLLMANFVISALMVRKARANQKIIDGLNADIAKLEQPTAKVVNKDDVTGMELVQINDHRIQYGGDQGDGYCYVHQSFECIEDLTVEELQAVRDLP